MLGFRLAFATDYLNLTDFSVSQVHWFIPSTLKVRGNETRSSEPWTTTSWWTKMAVVDSLGSSVRARVSRLRGQLSTRRRALTKSRLAPGSALLSQNSHSSLAAAGQVAWTSMLAILLNCADMFGGESMGS